MRCTWAEANDLEREYHDTQWGVPIHDDQQLFEMLILEGAQAGLSWDAILQRREGYRNVFHGFDIHLVAGMADDELEAALSNNEIIRNRLKVYGVRKNAQVVQAIIAEKGSFTDYLWVFVDGQPLDNAWSCDEEVPSSTDISEILSKDLKKRGCTFVGPTICYALMQSAGLVNDHVTNCFRYNQVKEMS